MKKQGILNRDISCALSKLGHTDTIVIADCGLPIPDGVKCIDLSLKLNVPRFMDVVEEIKKDFGVEKVILSEDIKTANESIYAQLSKEYESVSIALVPHEEFKQMTKDAKVIIRTGEASLYANVILQANCLFI